MPRKKKAIPYVRDEMAAILEAAGRQSTRKRRHESLVLIGCGAGAGLNNSWIRFLHGPDVADRDGVLIVSVGEPRARSVPVLDTYEDLVRRLADEVGNGLLLGGTSTNKDRTSKIAARFEVPRGVPRLSLPRLRSTWFLEHLIRGTRLPELMQVGGTTTIEVIEELFPFVPEIDELTLLRMLRGGQ